MKPTKHLLFLCHRIPYPPNKGDKIRSFNMLKKLSEHYQVHLAAFVDDQQDWQYQQHLDEYCASVCLVNLNKKLATLKSAQGLITGKPLTLPYFYHADITRYVRTTLASHPNADIFVFSSSMAQYVDGAEYQQHHRIIDFVDVDSDKWRQYAEKKSFPMNWVYQREGQLLEKEEVRLAGIFEKSLFVSPQEAEHFAKLVPTGLKQKVGFVLNGVDTHYFSPTFNEPISEQQPFITFTGAMDYWANVDAVVWFVNRVWPQLHTAYPQLRCYIVGGNPTDEVKALSNSPNVIVTGRVEDVRPYIKDAELCIAPMRIARGIQNKVLEAMSMGKATVMTQMAADGITIPEPQQPYVVDDSDAFANAVTTLLNDGEQRALLGKANRHIICEQFQWDATLAALLAMFDAKPNGANPTSTISNSTKPNNINPDRTAQ